MTLENLFEFFSSKKRREEKLRFQSYCSLISFVRITLSIIHDNEQSQNKREKFSFSLEYRLPHKSQQN